MIEFVAWTEPPQVAASQASSMGGGASVLSGAEAFSFWAPQSRRCAIIRPRSFARRNLPTASPYL